MERSKRRAPAPQEPPQAVVNSILRLYAEHFKEVTRERFFEMLGADAA